MTGLPVRNGTACDVAMSVNAVPLSSMMFDFLCLRGDQGGNLCAPTIANALDSIGLLDMATGRVPFNLSGVSISQVRVPHPLPRRTPGL